MAVQQISSYPLGKTNDIPYNTTSSATNYNVFDLYRIQNPIDIETVVMYIHAGTFINRDEEHENAINCKNRFNSEGYNVMSLRYTLQTHTSYYGALTELFTTGNPTSLHNWSVKAVVEATNDLIDAIEYIKQMGIKHIHLIGYSAGAIMALVYALGPNSTLRSNGLKSSDRSVIRSITSIAGSLTTQLGVEYWQGLDANSPNLMLWHGSIDETLVVSGAQSIKNRYDELGLSYKCTLNILNGAGHDDIWTIRSQNLTLTEYNKLLPLSAASRFISSVSNVLPLTPICFPKGTPVSTNQGNVAIEKLNPDIHTIRNKKIVAITQTKTLDKYIVSIEKDALGKNIPCATTQISKNHKILYKGKMVKSCELVDLCKGVSKIPYNGNTLYNVLMEEYDYMMINNLICETLHPEHIIAKIYGGEYINKNDIIMALNHLVSKKYSKK
jgi:dienelactone hydrolase